jgi:hypothetical protein
MRKSTRMMTMTTGQILVGGVVEAAVLAMAISMTTTRVRRTRRALTMGPGNGIEKRTGSGKGRGSVKETVNRRYC